MRFVAAYSRSSRAHVARGSREDSRLKLTLRVVRLASVLGQPESVRKELLESERTSSEASGARTAPRAPSRSPRPRSTSSRICSILSSPASSHSCSGVGSGCSGASTGSSSSSDAHSIARVTHTGHSRAVCLHSVYRGEREERCTRTVDSHEERPLLSEDWPDLGCWVCNHLPRATPLELSPPHPSRTQPWRRRRRRRRRARSESSGRSMRTRWCAPKAPETRASLQKD